MPRQEIEYEVSPPIGPRWDLPGRIWTLRAALLVAVLLSLLALLRVVHDSRRDRPSLFWPVATGAITSCESRFHGGRQPSYGVDVSYTYEVNGARFVSHQIKLWNPGLAGDRRAVNSFVESHPAQSTTAVYYNPEHPDIAALIPGDDETGNDVIFACGSIILIAGVWGFFKTLPGFGAPGEAARAPRGARGGDHASPHDRIV